MSFTLQIIQSSRTRKSNHFIDQESNIFTVGSQCVYEWISPWVSQNGVCGRGGNLINSKTGYNEVQNETTVKYYLN